MKGNSLLSEQELAEASFRLLTSSSIDRYSLVAKRCAQESDLYKRFSREPEMIKVIVNRARELWKDLLSNQKRVVEEAELAVLLPILAPTATPEAESFLKALLFVNRRNTAWVGALAKKLYTERSLN